MFWPENENSATGNGRKFFQIVVRVRALLNSQTILNEWHHLVVFFKSAATTGPTQFINQMLLNERFGVIWLPFSLISSLSWAHFQFTSWTSNGSNGVIQMPLLSILKFINQTASNGSNSTICLSFTPELAATAEPTSIHKSDRFKGKQRCHLVPIFP